MQVNVLGYQVKELFEKAKTALIILGKDADVDAAALAASLVELFESYNKKANLISGTTLPEAAKPLVKPEQIKSRLEPRSLVLSFDWQKSELDKISYNLEGNKFNLLIGSKGKKINPEEITYSYKGMQFDFILCIGVENFEALKAFGIEEETFVNVPSLNIDRSLNNENYAKVNLVNPKADSLAALAALLFKEAKINLPTRAAETMLFGIRNITANFANVSDPGTFEAAAYCKRCMIPGLPSQREEEKTQVEAKNGEQTPEGWLSPKIFRSSKFS